jgi:fructose-bisphosphate aldolase class II
VLSIDLLAKIYGISPVPLVLHGGSGLSDSDFTRTIQNGIRKVNICTQLCDAARAAYAQSTGFEQSLTDAKDAVKAAAREKMRLFGGAGMGL